MIDEAWIKELREVKRTHPTDHLHQPAPVPHANASPLICTMTWEAISVP